MHVANLLETKTTALTNCVSGDDDRYTAGLHGAIDDQWMQRQRVGATEGHESVLGEVCADCDATDYLFAGVARGT